MSSESIVGVAEASDDGTSLAARDPRQNSFPVSWRDWTDDPGTEDVLSGLVAELRISLRLTGEGGDASPATCPSIIPPTLKNVAKKRGRPASPKPYQAVAFQLLLNLCRVADVDPSAWLGYSRTEGDYTDRSLYPKNVSYFRVKKVVDWLEQAGWVESEPGYYDWNQRYGWQSLLRASPSLLERFAGFAPVVQQAPLADRELIRLKDASKGRVSDYEETPQLAVWRGKLRRINQQIASAKLGFDLSLEQMKAMVTNLRSRHCCPDLSRIQLYRSFNVTWDQGGRFYGGWWINLPSEYRPFITINGESTQELDFSSFHLSMIYGLEGLRIPDGDLYDIGWSERYRPMVKKFVNALLYAEKGEEAAIKAMQDFREDGIRELWTQFVDEVDVAEKGGKDGLLIPMLNAIKEKHRGVAHRFGKGESKRLQALDSDIAEKVLMLSVWYEVTVLPIHDSFIVPTSHAEYFCKVMQQGFEAHFAQTIGVKNKSAAVGKSDTRQENRGT